MHLLWLTLKSSFGGFKVLNQIILRCNFCIFLVFSMNEVVEKEHFWIFRNYILNIPVVSELALFLDTGKAEVVLHRWVFKYWTEKFHIVLFLCKTTLIQLFHFVDLCFLHKFLAIYCLFKIILQRQALIERILLVLHFEYAWFENIVKFVMVLLRNSCFP